MNNNNNNNNNNKETNAEITINVTLDKDKLPIALSWLAKEAGINKNKACKAILLSVWDAEENNTLKMDLWTKDMLVEDMKRFFFQTFMSMADTLENSTGEKNMAKDIRDFSDYFAEKMGVKK